MVGGIIPARAGFTTQNRKDSLIMTDHPRSRGVYGRGPWPWTRSAGSSPLARGLQQQYRAYARSPWIIPARAGFTTTSTPAGERGRDHPRSRGVYRKAAVSSGRRLGSSPLARGLHPRPGPDTPVRGIIPARAGFTARGLLLQARGWDHPRSRGVYDGEQSGSLAVGGSSPLARGLRVGLGLGVARGGIIPARAGFTRRSHHRMVGGGDHPRSRGVYARAGPAARSTWGSSPLARGLHRNDLVWPDDLRIIPARAGFTVRRAGSAVPTGDHPRSRGVYVWAFLRAVHAAGSSPLARGLPRDAQQRQIATGIIPARAGFTQLPGGDEHGGRDHPRSRGVYRTCACSRRARGGSSPLARGLPGGALGVGGGAGIIPARAGFTPLRSGRPTTRTDHPRSRGVYFMTDMEQTTSLGSSPLARGLRH